MTVTEFTPSMFEQLSRSAVSVSYNIQERCPTFGYGGDEIDHLEKSTLALAYEVYVNTVDPNASRETLLSSFSLRGFQIPGQGHRTHFHRIVLATREPGHMVVTGAPHADLQGAHRLLYDAVIAWRDHAKRGRAEWSELSYEGIFEWDGEFAMGTHALILGEPGDSGRLNTMWMTRDVHRQGFRSEVEYEDYMCALTRRERESGRGRRSEGRRAARRERVRVMGDDDDTIMEGWRRVLRGSDE